MFTHSNKRCRQIYQSQDRDDFDGFIVVNVLSLEAEQIIVDFSKLFLVLQLQRIAKLAILVRSRPRKCEKLTKLTAPCIRLFKPLALIIKAFTTLFRDLKNLVCDRPLLLPCEASMRSDVHV